MELEKFIETLFYGSDFGNYDSGSLIIVPEMHYRIFGVGFSEIRIDYKKVGN